MKKYLRRIGALLLTFIMVLSMCVGVWADDSPKHIIIKGISEEAGNKVKVTAYKIIKYDASGSYSEVIPNTINKDATGKLKPTLSDIEYLATLTGTGDDKLGTGIEITKEGEDYIAGEENGITAGTWMILVTGSEKYLYNPAIISVQQGTDGLEFGELDFETGKWTENNEIYMKKSEPKFEKTALTQNVNGVQYGDIIQFQIESGILKYTPGKKEVQYKISDTLQGLTLIKNDEEYKLEITVDGEEDKGLTTIVNEAIQDGQTKFEINIPKEYVMKYGGKNVLIKYYAKVTSDKKINVDKMMNTAELEYSVWDDVMKKTSDTRHYTFGIDTGFNKELQEEFKNQTGEFIKIDENGNVAYEEKEGNPTFVTVKSPLAGAQFQVHVGSENGELFTHGANTTGNYFETDDSGRLQINGLDSDETYYLIETKAPKGYSRITEAIKVTIKADYSNDALIGYSVKFETKGNKVETNYKYEETTGTTILLNDADHASNPFGFKNTKLSELPSTGGIGTYIFTVVGVMMMAGVAGMFIISRRKER